MRKRSAFGRMELIVGIMLVILGIFVITRIGVALTRVVMFYGLIAAIIGVLDIMLYAKTEQHIGLTPATVLISGMFSVMAGIILLVYPNAGKWTIALLLPIWFIAHCISRLSHLHMIRIAMGSFYCYVTLIVNILGLVLGCVMII